MDVPKRALSDHCFFVENRLQLCAETLYYQENSGTIIFTARHLSYHWQLSSNGHTWTLWQRCVEHLLSGSLAWIMLCFAGSPTALVALLPDCPGTRRMNPGGAAPSADQRRRSYISTRGSLLWLCISERSAQKGAMTNPRRHLPPNLLLLHHHLPPMLPRRLPAGHAFIIGKVCGLASMISGESAASQ